MKNVKFPIAVFKLDDPIIYFYSNESQIRKTSTELLQKGVWDNCTAIDSEGDEYSILGVQRKGLRGFFGWHPLLKGTSIWIDLILSESKKADIESIKGIAIEKVEKSRHFWEAAWEINDLTKEIASAKTFRDLILLFR